MKGYDIGLDRQGNDPLNIMLDNIRSGSKILEFGCANGRMTQYLNEVLSCSVDIVEYNEELYNMAIKYAHDGLCGNICDYTWLEKFCNETYDYIIFADVLEHLSTPQDVLENCYKLLKETGLIWISVPNIAFNDIIIKLLNNQFDYSDTGLLDTSHIHFFTEKSAKKMFLDAGYHVVYEDGIHKQTFCSEQLLTEYASWKPEYDYVLKRDLGELYQAVFALSKVPNYSFRYTNFYYYYNAARYYERRIYLDCGNGFKDAIITQELYENTDLQIDIPVIPDTSMVWICPAFKRRFTIKNLRIYADDRNIDYCKINAERRENDYYFTSLESYIYISDLDKCSVLKLRGTIHFDNIFPEEDNSTLTIDNEYKIESQVKEIFGVLKEENALLNEQLRLQKNRTEAIDKTYTQQILKLKNDYNNLSKNYNEVKNSLECENNYLQRKNILLNDQLLSIENELDEARKQTEILKIHLRESEIETTKFQQYVEVIANEILHLFPNMLPNVRLGAYEKIMMSLKTIQQQYIEESNQLKALKNTLSWKITAPFRRILNLIKKQDKY